MPKNQIRLFDKEIQKYEKRLIDIALQMGESKRQSNTLTTIILYLILHKKLTQKELKSLTGFSIGTISSALNGILSAGNLEKKLIKGTHAFEYTFGNDLPQLSSKTMILKKAINTDAKSFVEKEIAELKKQKYQGKSGRTFLLERLEGMMGVIDIHKKMLDIVKKRLKVGKNAIRVNENE